MQTSTKFKLKKKTYQDTNYNQINETDRDFLDLRNSDKKKKT